MTSGREVRMESSKFDLVIQLLTTTLRLVQDLQDHVNGEALQDGKAHPKTARLLSPLVAPPLGSLVNVSGDPRAVEPDVEYDLAFVAQQLGVKDQTVRKRIKDGEIKAELRGRGRGHYIVLGSELLKHLPMKLR
jgi:hypothetical protein